MTAGVRPNCAQDEPTGSDAAAPSLEPSLPYERQFCSGCRRSQKRLLWQLWGQKRTAANGWFVIR